jgi:hypothetical protein
LDVTVMEQGILLHKTDCPPKSSRNFFPHPTLSQEAKRGTHLTPWGKSDTFSAWLSVENILTQSF